MRFQELKGSSRFFTFLSLPFPTFFLRLPVASVVSFQVPFKGGIGIMNIMLVTVTERTREIGIRRAIGATRASIVSQFLIEAAMLCGLGGIVGILVGTVCSVVLSQRIVQMTIYPALWVTLAAFGLSVLLGVLFGSYPAAKASKLQPVEALRAE